MAAPTSELIATARTAEDWRERRMALVGLGYRDEAGLFDVFIEGLEDPVSDVRHAAVVALGRLGNPGAMPDLLRPKILASPDARVRWAAVAALGKLGDARVIDPLIDLVDDEEWLVSNEALVVLREKIAGIIAARDLRNARILVRMLNIPDPTIVELARDGLEDLGVGALPMLCEALDSVWEPVRSHAAQVLGAIGEREAEPALVRALGDARPPVRAAAARALGHIGSKASIRPLIAALGDFDDVVRKSIVEALVGFGESAVGSLCIALEHTGSKLARCAAIDALGSIGDERAIRILIAFLDSSYYLVRSAVIVALTRFGERVVEPLVAMLSYNRSNIDVLLREAVTAEDVEARVRAVRALGTLEDHRAVNLLKSLLSDPVRKLALAAQDSLERIGCSAWGRSGAATVLGQLGNPDVVPALLELLDDDSITVRQAAVEAIDGLEADAASVRLLRTVREDSAASVRRAALSVLWELIPGSHELFDVALGALADEDPEVRVRAAGIVGEYADDRATEHLLKLLSDPLWSVRFGAESALSSQGRKIVPQLLEILESGSLLARRRAVGALGRIGDPRATEPIRALVEAEQDAVTVRLAWEALLLLQQENEG